MAWITIDKACFNIGPQVLLDKACMTFEPNERVALVGRNGSGKSTLMKAIAGEITLDDGDIRLHDGVRVAYMHQDPPSRDSRPVFDVVAEGMGEIGPLLTQYHHAVEQGDLDAMQTYQDQLDANDGWSFQQKVDTVISQLSLPADKPLNELSGGWRRRVALARAMVSEPQVLLLDEPTNHMDIETVKWLEEKLLAFKGTIVFITHDRAFLRRLATRIIDLDRGELTSWPGDYEAYLKGKQEALEVEALHNQKFDKKLAQEETWIRQGIKARRTRNEGRVRNLQALRNERKGRVNRQGSTSMAIDDSNKSGKLVIEATNLNYSWEGAKLLEDFSVRIMRGDRIGLIGGNGCGKSTLLSILLDKLPPDTGKVRHGTQLQVAYFDQMRQQLNEEQTVIDSVIEGSEQITINGQSRHIMSYLSDFLFSPERARTKIAKLSGGERNRVLLAKIFSQPANVLVLDEPTNDLDVETLEVLESLLSEYQGTLILTSHDREFLDNTVTSVWVFEGKGIISEHVGGYSDWSHWKSEHVDAVEAKPVKAETKPAKEDKPQPKPQKAKKLSYKDQRELDMMPERIDALETEQTELTDAMSDPAFFQKPADEIEKATTRLHEVEAELEHCIERWAELEEMIEG